MTQKLLVTAQWDDEVGVWVATSEDIPGLVTEAKSLDDLVRRVVAVAPELLEDNAPVRDDPSMVADMVDLHILSLLPAA